LKDLIGADHISLRIMRGSILENEEYCGKEGNLVLYGLPFIGKGGNRDLQEYYKKVRSGQNDIQVRTTCSNESTLQARKKNKEWRLSLSEGVPGVLTF